MKSITAVKEVKSSGSSLAIHVTRELKHLSVGKDEAVKITIEKIE